MKNGRGRSNSFSCRFFQSHPSLGTSRHSVQTLLGQPSEPRKNDRTCRPSFASSLKAVVPGSFPGRSDSASRTPFPEPGAFLAENTRAAAHPYGTPTRDLQLCPWAMGPRSAECRRRRSSSSPSCPLSGKLNRLPFRTIDETFSSEATQAKEHSTAGDSHHQPSSTAY